MRSFCLGAIGMSPKEYDCITFYDLELKIKGFKDAQNRADRNTRTVAWSAYIGPHLDRKKLNGMTPAKFWPLEGEKVEKYEFKKKKKAFTELLAVISNGKVRDRDSSTG